MKILFITTRNIITPSGELRLIKNRAEAMRKYDIETIFYTYTWRGQLLKANNPLLIDDFELNFTEYSKKHLFTFFLNKYRFIDSVIERIKIEKDIKFIVISGFLPNKLLNKIKLIRNDVNIISDIHGASEELIEYGTKGSLLCFMKYLLINSNMKKQLNISQGVIGVSDGLQEYLKEKNIKNLMSNYYKIPCACENQEIELDKYYRERKKWRQHFSIDEDTKVFVYSGGASKWQMLRESVALYYELKQRLPFKCKLLIMSHVIDDIKKQIDIEDNDIIYATFNPNQVKDVLCCSDFAFMLREDTITNKVAFPNKFLEYVSTQNYIITTPFIKDIAKYVQEFKLGSLYNGDLDKLVQEIKLSCVRETKKENYNVVLKETSFEKTIQNLCEFILSNEGK